MNYKKLLVVFVLILSLTAGCSHQNTLSGQMDAVSCRTLSFSDGCGCFTDITVILNQSTVPDYQECAEEIIQHVINNDFHTIMFSFDENGYPIGLSANVYLTKADFENGNCLFHMDYSSISTHNYTYNIRNNPEMFTLTITE